jgi:hypothetical protein
MPLNRSGHSPMIDPSTVSEQEQRRCSRQTLMCSHRYSPTAANAENAGLSIMTFGAIVSDWTACRIDVAEPDTQVARARWASIP